MNNSCIWHRQQTYYTLLTESDQKSDCSAFIEFLLQAIEDSLQEAIHIQLDTEDVSVKTPVKTSVQTPALVLQHLNANPNMTLAEVAQLIGKSVRAVERAVAKLKQQGKLEFIGPKKGGHWLVIKN